MSVSSPSFKLCNEVIHGVLPSSEVKECKSNQAKVNPLIGLFFARENILPALIAGAGTPCCYFQGNKKDRSELCTKIRKALQSKYVRSPWAPEYIDDVSNLRGTICSFKNYFCKGKS